MRTITDVVFRVVTAAALIIAGVIHLQLATEYAEGLWFTQETSFRIVAVLAFITAAAVLVLPFARRLVWISAAGIAAGSLAALMISRYYNIQGYFPGIIYEPHWFYKKDLVAIVDAVAFVVAVSGGGLALLVPRSAGRRRAPAHAH